MTVRVHEVVDAIKEIARKEVFDPARRDDDTWIDDNLPDNHETHPVIDIDPHQDSTEVLDAWLMMSSGGYNARSSMILL